MAVILRDAPAARAALGDLKNLPFPISFVVDAGAADAAQAIAFYRAAGAEVVVALSLPDGATPTDAEVVLQAQEALFADAVATLFSASFQTAGATARQVAAVMQDGGHGLISIPQGLNTGHKSAVKEGVEAGLVFRELDNDGQSAAVIRRFMDNAAFKARQEPGVIMLGHARVETVQALIEWSLGNRAKSVALAPVSAVLQDK
nr:divergent polysaccharide deacetylase family protein [Aliiroseovarius subalbicans]